MNMYRITNMHNFFMKGLRFFKFSYLTNYTVGFGFDILSVHILIVYD